MVNSAKKVYNTKHRLIRPDIRYSMFKVATNMGTGTVDYWLWIMDHKPWAVFGQYIAARVCCFFDMIAKLIKIFFLSLPKFSSSSSCCKFCENY